MKILPSKFDVQFMNLGYIPRAESRDNLQLVHEILGPEKGIHAHVNLYEKALSLCPSYPNLKDYKLLEVGCGLSGGIKWILQSHSEIDSIIGVDRVVGDSLNGLVKYSDAHNLDFPDETFDLVINIESSHLYTYPERFFKEIWRVLKPNGYFCWADLRLTNEIDSTLQSVYGSGLRLITYQNITRQVINGINHTSQRYDQMIDQAPWYIKWFKNSIRTTYCAPGTESYQRFLAGEKVYAVACWQKVIKS
uniref:Methyltransferase type 11 domain-containing protein n=1 Tax=Acrobeloides nanus TaxID=290746 RepID=A0A914DL44_9BILA